MRTRKLPTITIKRYKTRELQMFDSAFGITRFAAAVSAALLIAPSAMAQAVPDECLMNSTGPVFGDAAPYDGGMCNLGTLGTNASSSEAFGISGDGRVVVGFVEESATARISAFAWTSDGGMIELPPLSTVATDVLWRARRKF